MNKAQKSESLALKMSDGSVVRGVFHLPREGGEVPTVVFAHGFGSTRSGEKATALAAECGRRGWAFAACDFRGHGESDGTMLELRGSRVLEDLDAITRTVAARAGGPLYLFGSSMGGWAAAWLSARAPDRIAACAFVAPSFHFLEWSELSKAEREEWERTGRRRVRNEFVDVEIGYALTAEAADFKVDDLVVLFRSPLIIFHGMRDEIVPYADSLDFAARCASPDVKLMIFKNGDHRLNSEKDLVAHIACDFFANYR